MSTIGQVDMQHFRLKLAAILFDSPFNTARDRIEEHVVRDEIFDPNDCVMIEPTQMSQMTCRNYKDTASAICNFILSTTDEESLG
jgi:hypothetical protein